MVRILQGDKACIVLGICIFAFVASSYLASGRIDSGMSRSATLGGALSEFRLIAKDAGILAAEHYWHEGQWYRLPPLYEMTLRIAPEHREGWQLLGWFYAFNWAEAANTPEKRQGAVFKGIETLERGLRFHHHSYHLYFDIAWIYYKKLSNYESAIQYLELACQREHPVEVERLLALAFYHSGKPEAAANVWKEYLTLHPHSKFALKELTRIQEMKR